MCSSWVHLWPTFNPTTSFVDSKKMYIINCVIANSINWILLLHSVIFVRVNVCTASASATKEENLVRTRQTNILQIDKIRFYFPLSLFFSTLVHPLYGVWWVWCVCVRSLKNLHCKTMIIKVQHARVRMETLFQRRTHKISSAVRTPSGCTRGPFKFFASEEKNHNSLLFQISTCAACADTYGVPARHKDGVVHVCVSMCLLLRWKL